MFSTLMKISRMQQDNLKDVLTLLKELNKWVDIFQIFLIPDSHKHGQAVKIAQGFEHVQKCSQLIPDMQDYNTKIFLRML